MANLTYQQVKALLRTRGFSPSAIESIRDAMIDDAVRNASGIHSDRILTIVALMLNEAYGFGYKRIYKGLQVFDELTGKISRGEIEWPDMMEELEDKTGIVVRTDEDNRVAFEYKPKGEERE